MTSSAQAPVVLVTGGGQRIGAAIARRQHAAGWRVLVHVHRSREAGAALVAQLNAQRADSAQLLQADLADESALLTLAREAQARWQRLDALVNNASSYYPTPLGQLRAEQADELYRSNARAPLLLSQACAPWLQAIVNIVDTQLPRPPSGYAAYFTAKAGLWAQTLALAQELAPRVRVNGVAPGHMLWGEGDADPEHQARELARIPLQRLGGGEEVAHAVHFLLSPEAAYITGAILPVDGGLRLN